MENNKDTTAKDGIDEFLNEVNKSDTPFCITNPEEEYISTFDVRKTALQIATQINPKEPLRLVKEIEDYLINGL